MKPDPKSPLSFWQVVPLLCALAVLHSAAAIPPAEKLLPDDTLLLVSVPDFAKFKEAVRNLPECRLLQDESMKPFREKLLANCEADLLKPLEQELRVSLVTLGRLPQGQLTFAMTQNGWPAEPGSQPGWLVLLDARDNEGLLRTNLAALLKEWIAAGKPIRTEKIRDLDFSVLPLSTNRLPNALRKFFPSRPESPVAGEEAKAAPVPGNLYVGQAGSLLLVGDSSKVLEKVLVRLSGSSVPTLGEQAAFDSCYRAFFRDAPAYGWLNARALLNGLARKTAERPANADPSEADESVFATHFLDVCGLGAIRTLSVSLRETAEGLLLEANLAAPVSERRGLLGLLAGEAKGTRPPPFVPADAVSFRRWRLDAQKACVTLANVIEALLGPSVRSLNLVFETADAKARFEDPGYDLKKSLLTSLGDDIITYQKAPRGSGQAAEKLPATLLLLGSPNPQQLAIALKNLLIFLPEGDSAAEREFLGRKVYSVPSPTSLPLPFLDKPGSLAPGTLYYSWGAGYVALSTDVALLEEFLSGNANPAKGLREAPGLLEAAQRVTGPGTDFLGYGSRVERMRAAFEGMRGGSGGVANGNVVPVLPALPGMGAAAKGVRAWMEGSLLPPFDRVAKYFYFTVSGGSANGDGLTYKWFAPTPPGLRN